MLSTAKISSGSSIIEEDKVLKWILTDPHPLDYMGSCYGRSPPKGRAGKPLDLPPSLWKILEDKCPSELLSEPGHQPPIYDMTDLRYDDPSGQDDSYVMDDSDDIYVMPADPVSQSAPTCSVQSGYQDRRALRGTSRGYRSQSSYARRLASRKSKQQEFRRDFRQWKSRCKDSSLRTHGDQNPSPLICPKPAAQRRLCSQSRSFSQGYNQLRHVDKPVAVPAPTGFSLQLARGM